MPYPCCRYWLSCRETSLTGEGHAHTKVVLALEPMRRGDEADGATTVRNDRGGIPLAECKNMVFMGTLTCGGHAKAVVTATGEQNVLLRLSSRNEDVSRPSTPVNGSPSSNRNRVRSTTKLHAVRAVGVSFHVQE